MGFYSYASPRVRREARDQITDIQNSSSLMYTTLLNARRVDAVAMSLQAERAREELRRVQQDILEKDAYIMRLQAELRGGN